MARVSHRWPFGHPSTSDLDQVKEESAECCGRWHDSHRRHVELRDEIELLLLEAERQKINELFRSGKLKDEARRRIDVREAHSPTSGPRNSVGFGLFP